MSSWADDENGADLGAPPPPTGPPSPKRRTYATIAVEVAKPLLVQQPRVVILTPPQVMREPWGLVPPSRPKRAPVVQKARPQKPPEQKCDNCHENRGYLKFTERHFEAQPKEGLHRLQVGTYCLQCVTAAAPRCMKSECIGRTTICLPEARYPFSLFCSPCMAAHRASREE